MNRLSISNLLNSNIPISRFNKGEAGKIFKELERDKIKVVYKNNIPTCVMIEPKEFNQMVEDIENYFLLLESASRLKDNSDIITHEDLLKELGISEEDLSNVKVDIE